ncbi:MAG: hypothetical protein JXQ71_07990 [Verrucomicrobia bacterium]|nr:hypothetical protein [Verrucomicrobiota bacterium]
MNWRSALAIGWLVSSWGATLAAQAQLEEAYLRKLQELRMAVIQQERLDRLTTNAPPASAPTFEALEKQFLEGKLTARQFQQYVLDFKLGRPPASPKPVPTPAPARIATPTASTNTPPAAGKPASDDPAMDRLALMEAQMDRIIQEKTARDRALTNPPAAAASGAKTRRERLDDLLRERIAGRITDEQYKVRWTQIISEKP